MIKLDSKEDYELFYFFKESILYYCKKNERNPLMDFSGRDFMNAICEYGVNTFGLLTEEVFRHLGIINIKNLDNKASYLAEKGLVPKIKGLYRFSSGYLYKVLHPLNIEMKFMTDEKNKGFSTKYRLNSR